MLARLVRHKAAAAGAEAAEAAAAASQHSDGQHQNGAVTGRSESRPAWAQIWRGTVAKLLFPQPAGLCTHLHCTPNWASYPLRLGCCEVRKRSSCAVDAFPRLQMDGDPEGCCSTH